jgi:lipopolysaccharide transport system permease protein
MSISSAPISVSVIRPSKGRVDLRFRELWRFRELVFFLTWRDIKVRYKQTLLGAAWAILKPLFTMVVFNIIFGRLAGLSTDGAPGPLFYFAGLLPWILFQDGVSKAGMALVTNRNLITKVYFPRLVMPLSAVGAGLVDFVLASLVLVGMMIYFRAPVAPEIWTALVFVLWALITSLGVGLWMGALNVLYRDIGYVIPFVLQAWMYASPVAYSTAIIPEGIWRSLYGLNPMAGVVHGFRWAVLGVGDPPSALYAVSAAVSVLLLVTGLMFFRRMERTFADVV